MNILLDTHIFLWAFSDDPLLPQKAREMIVDTKNDILYSFIFLWETEFKDIAHPENLRVSAKEIEEYCKILGFSLL